MTASRREPRDSDRSSSERVYDADDLEIIEPVVDAEEIIPELGDPEPEELEELDSWADDGSVEVTTELPMDEAAPRLVQIAVGDIAKSEIASSIAVPVRAALVRLGRAVRHRDVVFEFTGDALISSAARNLIGEIAAEFKLRSAVVQRGYGDEVVHEGAAPELPMSVTPTDGGVLIVAMNTSGLDAGDLEVLLPARVDELAGRASGQKFAFAFSGGARPDEAMIDALGARLGAAGALRVAVGGDGGETRVLLDRELESRVEVTGGSCDDTDFELVITPGPDLAATVESLELVLPRLAERFAGQRVHARLGAGNHTEEAVEAFVRRGAKLGAASIVVEGPDGVAEQHWPPLLKLAAGRGVATLRVQPGSRDRDAVLRAFRREASRLRSKLEGARVTVDWPAGFELDAAVEAACAERALCDGANAASVAFSVSGAGARPVFPPAVVVRPDPGGGVECIVDTELAKPAELVVEVVQRCAAAADLLRGSDALVKVTGGAAVPRKLRAAIVGALEVAGVERGRIDDGSGVPEIVLPALLHIEVAEQGMRVSLRTAGRDAGQVARALENEMASAALPEDADVLLPDGEHTAALVDAFRTAGAARISIASVDGGVPLQVHPRLFAPPKREGKVLRIKANPSAADDAQTSRQVDHELKELMADQGDLSDVTVVLGWPDAKQPFSLPVENAVNRLGRLSPAGIQLDRGGQGTRRLRPDSHEFVTVLGRRDGAEPPMTLLGIDASDGVEDLESIEAALDGLDADLIDGRRLLFVVQQDGKDRALADNDPVILGLRRRLEPRVAALLAFRQNVAGRHFVVLFSKIDQLQVGAKMRDPRG